MRFKARLGGRTVASQVRLVRCQGAKSFAVPAQEVLVVFIAVAAKRTISRPTRQAPCVASVLRRRRPCKRGFIVRT